MRKLLVLVLAMATVITCSVSVSASESTSAAEPEKEYIELCDKNIKDVNLDLESPIVLKENGDLITYECNKKCSLLVDMYNDIATLTSDSFNSRKLGSNVNWFDVGYNQNSRPFLTFTTDSGELYASERITYWDNNYILDLAYEEPIKAAENAIKGYVFTCQPGIRSCYRGLYGEDITKVLLYLRNDGTLCIKDANYEHEKEVFTDVKDIYYGYFSFTVLYTDGTAYKYTLEQLDPFIHTFESYTANLPETRLGNDCIRCCWCSNWNLSNIKYRKIVDNIGLTTDNKLGYTYQWGSPEEIEIPDIVDFEVYLDGGYGQGAKWGIIIVQDEQGELSRYSANGDTSEIKFVETIGHAKSFNLNGRTLTYVDTQGNVIVRDFN